MNAIVSGARSRSTLLTGAAGLLLLVTAIVMMVCTAPRLHAARPGPAVQDRLASWVWVGGPGHHLIPQVAAPATQTKTAGRR